MNEQLLKIQSSKQNVVQVHELEQQQASINHANSAIDYEQYVYDDSSIKDQNQLQLLRKQTQSEKKRSSLYQKLKFRISKTKDVNWEENQDDRRIKVGENNIKYPSNQIKTSRYTVLSFLPLNLFEQFSKLANIYFLIMGFMQMIPPISNTYGLPTVYLPLAFVLTIAAIKDLVEDLKRRSSDKLENQQICHKVEEEKKIVDVFSENLLCGNIIKIKQNEQIPADVILLKTSDGKGNCYIETKNLDGETNLKPKFIQKDIYQKFNNDDISSLFNKDYYINYECANPLLYKFNGTFILGNSIIPLDEKNIILRGCFLRNTEWIYGIVVYTGHECKIMLNSHTPDLKKSSVETIMNKLVFIVWICQICLCALGALGYCIWYHINENIIYNYIYVQQDEKYNPFVLFLLSFGNWLMIFLNFIPISLIISLEMIRFLQGMIICNEKLMKSKSGFQPNVQSSNLNEDLGQIQCIFSDKTGTLTCNVMCFKSFYLDGETYGTLKKSKKKAIENVDFEDDRINENSIQNNQKLYDFILHLALCHEIIYNEKDNKYQASSPDDLALVNFAKFQGFEFVGTDGEGVMSVKVKSLNQILKFKVLHILEFSSERKRMSIILKDMNTQEIHLLSKGADSTLIPRFANQSENISKLQQVLEDYSKTGLRTLVLGKKIIQKDAFENWNAKYSQALNLLKDKEQKMEELADQIERNLDFIGATAIEDELQDEVGKTIEVLKNAGIYLWILTGDKKETAINIGFSTKVLSPEDNRIEINNIRDLETLTLSNDKSNTIVITGETLSQVFENEELKRDFIEKSTFCKSVIACRVSPKQKKEIVQYYKAHPINSQKRTLAIGDGANDVSMILEAHVGVGIRGLEGMQAARSSDYSIGEFKLLRRLLLFHGRECYRRNSVVILYNFYKNVMYLGPMMFLGIFSGFSGAFIYDMFLFQCFNAMFTALPIIFYAVMDKDLSSKILVQSPHLYRTGIDGVFMNYKQFLIWFGNGFWHAAIIFFISMFSLNSIEDKNGRTNDQIVIGQVMFMTCVFVANIKVCIHSYTSYSSQYMLQAASIGFYLILLIGVNFYLGYDLFHVLNKVVGQWYFYLVLILTLFCCLVIDYGMVVYGDHIFYMQLREQFSRLYVSQNIKEISKIENEKQFRNTLKVDFQDNEVLNESIRDQSLSQDLQV